MQNNARIYRIFLWSIVNPLESAGAKQLVWWVGDGSISLIRMLSKTVSSCHAPIHHK